MSLLSLDCPKIEFQNTTIESLKCHYNYGTIKLKKKKEKKKKRKNCMELEFMELEFQNAAIRS